MGLCVKILSMKIAGFRGISKLQLHFSDGINVLVGDNGAGKSAILDCTAILLSRMVGRIRSATGTGRHFSLSDINNELPSASSEISLEFKGQTIRWRVTKNRRGRIRQLISGLTELKLSMDAFRRELDSDESTQLPLAVYYPVNRAVPDIPLRIRRRHPFDRLAAYDQALSGNWNRFRIFFEWYREREDLENENRLERSWYRDIQLQAVRKAIERFLPGFQNLKVRRSPLRMVVEKDKKELVVNQLSDGEKCMLAMVGDLARRMAIANPYMNDPLACDAIVLVDEIELHLHPVWQRKVANALSETFPNCQFILSTHSPAILGHLQAEQIWALRRREGQVSAVRPHETYGKAIDRLLEDVMDVPSRPSEVETEIGDLFLAIKRNELEAARQQLKRLSETIGNDPALVKAAILIRRKKQSGNEAD